MQKPAISVRRRSTLAQTIRTENWLHDMAQKGFFLRQLSGNNYWFEQGPRYWGRAYGYYTGFGALALDPQQRDAVREILNQQRFNRKLLALSVLLFLLLFSTLVFVPGARLWAARRAAGVPCAVLAAGLLVYTGLRCRTRPYEPIYFAPAGVFGFWAVYTLIRLL